MISVLVFATVMLGIAGLFSLIETTHSAIAVDPFELPENATVKETVDFTITSKEAVHTGGMGMQYYLYGVTTEGESVKYAVTGKAYALVQEGQTVPHIEYTTPTAIKDVLPISFGTTSGFAMVAFFFIVFW